MDIELIDLIQFVLEVQRPDTALMAPTCTGTPVNPGDSRCYASAFTAVGAAFSTMGYWVQSDLLDEMIYGGMGLYAPLLYILSAAGGIVSMAMGQPPRTYLWFFMGPAIFNWLLDTRTEVTGVAWRVADRYQDQREVWKLAEVGLVNTSLFDDVVAITGVGAAANFVTANRAPQLPNLPSPGGGNFYPVRVAMPFLWFDALVSDTIQNLVQWTGIYRQRSHLLTSSGGPVSTAVRSNINISSTPNLADNKWFLLSNLKWSYLDDITGAKLANPLMRDAFTTFLGSECGDMMKASIHAPAFTAAANTKGYGVPTSVFKTEDGAFFNYRILKTNLRAKAIPTPETLKDVLQEKAGNSFQKAIGNPNWTPSPGAPGAPGWFPADVLNAVLLSNRIRCDTYLDLLVLFFRWEASNIYQMTFVNSSGTGGMDDMQLVFNLLYGWDIKKDRTRSVLVTSGSGATSSVELVVGNGSPLTPQEQVRFIHNLILVHLFRNEFATAPAPMDVRYSMSDQAINYVEAYQRTVGSKSKYGEIYTWALMIPYIQGILMYLLAIGYPFACIMMVMPGMHKVIFTWMSFWAWVKLWDLGFAIVMSLERSVWAMIGNKAQITTIFDRIVEMDLFGRSDFVNPASVPCASVPKAMGGCLSRYYEIMDPAGNLYTLGGTAGSFTINVPSAPTFGATAPATGTESYTIDLMDSNLRFLDLGMTLGASLDLDLANGYYIYIMAALYMAVPAVTGQLVLGAKAGAASMVGTAIGGASQESGRVAGQGYQGDVIQRMKSNAASLSQASIGKSHRASGFAATALGMGNASANAGMDAAYQGELGSAYGRRKEQLGLARGVNEAGGGFAISAVGAAANLLGGAGGPRHRDDGGPEGGGGGGGGNNGVNMGNLRRALKQDPGANPQQDGLLKRALTGDGLYRTLGGANSWGAASEHARGSSALTGAQADASISGFNAGQQAKGFGEHGGRMNAQANHRAGMDRWKAMTQFANQLGGTSAALGLFAGGLDAGPKPEEATGMAMSGMLGAGAQNAAKHFDPSKKDGFFGGLSGRTGGLFSRHGGEATRATYDNNVRSPRDQFMTSMGYAADAFKDLNPFDQNSGGGGGN